MNQSDESKQGEGAAAGGEGISWGLYRDLPERMFLGVAAALARYLKVPALWVRAALVVLSFVHLLGPVIYLIAWAFIPFRPKDKPMADRVVAESRQFAEASRGIGQRLGVAGRAFLKTFRETGPETTAGNGDDHAR